MKILLSTGETSGERIVVELVEALRAREPELELIGIGGERMAGAGVRIVARSDELGAVGLSEAAWAIPGLVGAFLKVRPAIDVEPPAVAVLIGNDLFHVLLARWLRRRGVATASFFPPQPWIWRAVARPIARSFDLLLTCFPAEQQVYSRALPGGDVRFVGHYLADRLRPPTAPERDAARARLGVAPGRPLVALLPGSRRTEVERLAPVLLGAGRLLVDRDPRIRLVLPVARPALEPFVRDQLGRSAVGDAVTIVSDSHEAMRAADIALVASGTATLECTLQALPMVVVYRLSSLTRAVVRLCVRLGLLESETIGLPNLLAARPIVPELKQGRATPERVAREAWQLLTQPARRESMMADLRNTASLVTGGDSIDQAAAAILQKARAVAAARSVSPPASARIEPVRLRSVFPEDS